MATGGNITTSGKNLMINRSYKSSPDYSEISEFKIGIGTTTPSTSDTDLAISIPIDDTEQEDSCDSITNWSQGTDGAISLNNSTYKEGTGSINLYKTAGTVDNVLYYNNNNMTSSDFTSKDLWVFFYISTDGYSKLATTDAVELRFGNDYNTNYYYRRYDKADLSSGWNYLIMNTTTGTEEGSVTLGSCDSGGIKITYSASTDEITEGNAFLTDDWKLAEASDYEKIFVSGYPTFDETNKKVTVRCHLTTLEANGYQLSEIGTFNTDGTPVMMDRDVFTAQSKTNLDEFAFVIINEME